MKYMILAILIPGIMTATDYSRIPLLRWAGPPGSHPETYEEWIEHHPHTKFDFHLDQVIRGDGRAGNVAIITAQSIAGALDEEIDQLCDNMQAEGYTIYNYQMSGGTPESLRTLLHDLNLQENIEGALLIGNLPIAWFEVRNDFYQYGYADFPCDLYFMDLDGTWLDTLNTGNGKYDGHVGNIVPEIYVSRLMPTGFGNDTLLLQNYFHKDNAYRHDTLLLQQRALVFVDDDWEDWAPSWASDVALMYPDTMNYWHPETTRGTIYRTKLNTIQAWVALFAHSWPDGHQFAYSGTHDYYYSYEYTNQNPPTNFFNFFCCSFSRYTQDCGGNRAIFNMTSGIGSIGSTKTGSMLEFYYFYQPLGAGKTLGEAFKDWFTYITGDGVTFDELCWHYGMTLLADCWLKPIGHNTAVAEQRDSAVRKSQVTILNSLVVKEVQLHFTLEHAKTITVTLYDNLGRCLGTLMKKNIAAGATLISFPATDPEGHILPAGVYILHVALDKDAVTCKMIKL